MTLDERVAYLEGRVEEQTRQTDGIRDATVHLEERMDRRFEGVDVRLHTFEDRMDRRFEAVDLRLQGFEDRVDRRFEGIDHRLQGIDRRLDVMDEKYSRYFVWMLAAQVTTLAAVVTAFVAR